MILFLQEICKINLELAAGIGYGGVEIFPKQREVLVDRGDIGSWLNMPYFEGETSVRYGS